MSDDAAVRSDIDFYLWEGESLRGSFIYSTDLFDELTIAQMSSRLLGLLEEITAAPENLLADLLASAKPEPLDLSLTATTDKKAPFSYHQERLWFIDQFENGNVYESAPTYHNIPSDPASEGRHRHGCVGVESQRDRPTPCGPAYQIHC